jgi:hypothetical protein
MSTLLICFGLFIAMCGNDFGWLLAFIGFFMWMTQDRKRR